MKLLRLCAIALATAGLLAGCGGGDDPPAAEKITYTKLVSFGDSLSDIGTYAVSGVAAVGGGKYTVNGAGAQIWVERLATAAKVPAPCAAQTGLNATQALIGFPPAPVVNNASCYGYAQGGARVTNPIGPYNAALLAIGDAGGALGQLTDPIVNQITRHLAAAGGSFSGTDLVVIQGGPNDLFVQLGTVSATVAAGGNATTAGQAATAAMGLAGGQLGAYIKSMIAAKGAKRVVVVNLPDMSKTPFGLSQAAATRDLIELMSFTFNANLEAQLADVPQVLVVDTYGLFRSISANPGSFGLSNVTATACNLTLAVLGSLGCSAATLISGDVSKYGFADSVHPSPAGHEVLSKAVVDALTAKGWL
jgi:phospholipase/lecithinase/hemolysin